MVSDAMKGRPGAIPGGRVLLVASSQAPVASLKHWPNGQSNAGWKFMLHIIGSGVPQMDGHELAHGGCREVDTR